MCEQFFEQRIGRGHNRRRLRRKLVQQVINVLQLRRKSQAHQIKIDNKTFFMNTIICDPLI